MSLLQRGAVIGLLAAGASALLFWASHHQEVTFADGLRYVREAQLVESGDLAGGLLRATDHPAHPLAIAAAHAVLGGIGPYAWQTAAQVAAVLALVLAVVPVYLLARELYGEDLAAFLGTLFVFANGVVAYVAVNVLSESTFLLFWAWGLWASVRFLREGRFGWLVPAVAFGALAYLTRPEGLLLHLAMVATLLALPLHPATRIYWPRWAGALAVLVIGPAVLVGPYVAFKGGLGTKPAVARVIGTLPESPSEALEREHPGPEGRSTAAAYAVAAGRVLKAFRGVVTWPLVPFALLGLAVAPAGPSRARLRLFTGLILAASAVGLARLHVTGGYLTVRHALAPGLLLTLAAGRGLSWLIRNAAVDARALQLGEGRLRPGPAVWAVVVLALAAWPFAGRRTPYDSSFSPYRQAGSWIEATPDAAGRVLDLTDWSLFFSNRPGYGIAGLDEAVARPGTRWLVVRDDHLTSHGRSGQVARSLADGREPALRFPDRPAPGRSQVLVFDLARPSLAAGATGPVRR